MRARRPSSSAAAGHKRMLFASVRRWIKSPPNRLARTRPCPRLSCGAGYGCAYFNTISWRTPTVPLPMENSPQVVFEKLFGDGGTTEQRLSRKREDRSILDSIVEQTLGLQKGLPSSDRARVDG